MSVSKMQRLTVFAFREDADRIVNRLMNLRCVEVRAADPERGAVVFPYLNVDEELAGLEQKISAINDALPVLAKYATRKKGLARKVLRTDREAFLRDGRADAAMETVRQTQEYKEQLHSIETERSSLEAQVESLAPWIGFDLPLGELSTAKTKTVLGAFPASAIPEEIGEALAQVGAFGESVATEKTGAYFAVTYLREQEQEVEQLLTKYGFLKTEHWQKAP